MCIFIYISAEFARRFSGLCAGSRGCARMCAKRVHYPVFRHKGLLMIFDFGKESDYCDYYQNGQGNGNYGTCYDGSNNNGDDDADYGEACKTDDDCGHSYACVSNVYVAHKWREAHTRRALRGIFAE